MKKLLSIDELIEHMKQKGITFKEVSESDAKEFLQVRNISVLQYRLSDFALKNTNVFR